MDQLIEGFRKLHAEFGKTKHCSKPGFYRAHVEMFHLAQAICTIHNPDAQQKVDELRKEIMRVFTGEIHRLSMIESVMRPASFIVNKRWTWQDYQITPEIACDPRLTGAVVSRRLVANLNKALRTQHQTVLRKCGL